MLAWSFMFFVLATVNLERYPAIWFEEGSYLHVPKTLVQFGVYAGYSIEGFRDVSETVGVGPTVLLPIAAVFSVTGIGLVQARLVMVAYLLAAVITFALVTRRLHGGTVALLASTLLISAPGVHLLYIGRQVLGEVPAIAFLMLGLLVWMRSVESTSRRWVHLLAASLAFALMTLTKAQFGLILVLAFGALLVANRIHYRALRPPLILVPCLFVTMSILLAEIVRLSEASLLDQVAGALPRLSREVLLLFSPARILSSLKATLSADVFAFWALPGLLYGVLLARPRTVRGAQHGLLLAFATIGIVWYAFGSIGWSRYAIAGLTLTSMLVGRLLVDLVRAQGAAADEPGRWRAWALTCLIVVMLGSSLIGQTRAIITSRDSSAQQMAAYLDDAVPNHSIIETWEPEIGFLTNHAYHYPHQEWLNRAVRAQWLEGRVLSEYDPFEEVAPSYLLVGKFGKYTGIYGPYLRRTQPELLASIGEYDLYWLKTPLAKR